MSVSHLDVVQPHDEETHIASGVELFRGVLRHAKQQRERRRNTLVALAGQFLAGHIDGLCGRHAALFGRESLGYDGYHYTYSLKNFREKGGGGKASSRERDGAPPRCTVVGVLDFIRASRLLDEHVCPAACAPQ